MKSWLIALICTAFLHSMAQGYDCNGNNPCQLDNIFYTMQNGYQCVDQRDGNVLCICPGGVEQNYPCRPCNRTNPLLNACQNTPALVTCLETTDYGTSYVCLCNDGTGNVVATVDANCNTGITVTTRSTTTTTAGSSSQCLNGGVLVNGQCNCPSGYSAPRCADRYDTMLCDRVVCKNNGSCAIRNTNGPYEGVCLCHYGTNGEYCELTGTLGSCTSGLCSNGGACRENVVGATRHAYCYCPPGYNGIKCDNRYFICPSAGKFYDYTMADQGKYFECTNVGGALQLTQKSCARGLRFNPSAQICAY